MKRKKILTALALVLALAGAFALGASAAGGSQTITATLNYGLTVEYNGDVQTMTDANGVQVYPISYNDTTYLPVRAVSNMLGLPVGWDEDTQTVQLGTPPDGLNFIDTFTPYSTCQDFDKTTHYDFVQSSEGQSNTIAGITTTRWITLHNDNAWDRSVYGHYNIGGKYNTLTFQAYATGDRTLEVRGDDDKLLASIDLTANQLPKTYSVPLVGSSQLCFASQMPGRDAGYSEIYIFNAYLT